ncbi:choice-of-anchor D domain-containing protein [bacterium]|nr:choice-of-anchor D domain-containing protein [bacterium]
MKSKYSLLVSFFNAIVITGAALSPASFASLAFYDAEISDAHGGGAGTLPYASVLTTPAVFDGTNIELFDFGTISGDATFEFILSGDPVAGGNNGYIGRADANPGNSLRYEQWSDTGALGFTRAGVADNFFSAPNAASPTDDTHVTYRWTEATGTMDLFINGAATDSIAGATFEMPTGPGHLGNVSDGGNEGMIGTISRVTTYNSLLDDTTIQQHANAWLATGDPSIGVPMNVDLVLDGSAQSFGLVLKNLGESNVLTITAVTVDGVNADYFTIDTALPLNIDPGEEIDLEYTVDPGGTNGDVEADFSIFSNDALNSEAEVQLSGLIRDPQISIQPALDFGASDVEVTQLIEIQNLGRARALNLRTLEITGTDAAKFSASGPASIAAGGSGNIEVTFTPDNTGGFTAQLEIGSDDPGSPLPSLTTTKTEAEHSQKTKWKSIATSTGLTTQRSEKMSAMG